MKEVTIYPAYFKDQSLSRIYKNWFMETITFFFCMWGNIFIRVIKGPKQFKNIIVTYNYQWEEIQCTCLGYINGSLALSLYKKDHVF